MGGPVHRARRVEEQTLEDAVIEQVEQASCEASRHQEREPPRHPETADAEAHRGDADVLRRGVSEQALHVPLRGGVEHPEERRRGAEHENGPSHPFFGPSQEEEEAEEREQACLVDHARHQRRHVSRRGRVRARQPRVEREEGRFQRERDAEEEEGDAAEPPWLRQHRSERAEVHRAGLGVHEHERSDEDEQADVRRDQVVEPREADPLVAVVPDHHQPGGDGGDLPSDQEHERVLCRVDDEERERRHVEQRELRSTVATGSEVRLQVPDRVDRPEQRHRQRPREEEGAQRIDAKVDVLDRIRPVEDALERRARAEDTEEGRADLHARGQLSHDGRRCAEPIPRQRDGENRSKHQQSRREHDRRHDQELRESATGT